MTGGDGEWVSRNVEIRWGAWVGDADVEECGGVREECEDVRTDSVADVGGFDLRRSAQFLDEGARRRTIRS